MSASKQIAKLVVVIGAGALAITAQSAWAGEVHIGSLATTIITVDSGDQLNKQTISRIVKATQQTLQAQQQQQQQQQAEKRIQLQ